MRSIIKLVVFFVIGLLIYNFFFGDEKEKEQSRAIFQTGKNLVSQSFDLLKGEKEKFDDGKYDNALAQMEDLFQKLESEADKIGGEYPERLAQLEQKKKQLERQLNTLESYKDYYEEEEVPEEFASKGGETERTRPNPKAVEKVEKQSEFKDDYRKMIEDMKGLMEDMEEKVETE